MSSTSYAQVCGCINCPVDIEDQSVSVATFVVAGAENNSLTTNEVDTVFIKFRHSFPSELQMKLISPAGQAVTLIGPQGTAASAIFFGGFNVRFVANVIDTDPDPGMSSIWHNADLSGINQYDGAYLPHSGSLQNFNTGTVNGEWLLEITDPAQFDFGVLEDLQIQFKDPLGINCCEADSGTMDDPDITACPGAENLLLDISPTFIGAAPNSALYDYTYLVTLDGLLIEVSDQPDLRSAAPGTYRIYGLSYELLDILLIPAPNGTLTISSIKNLLDAENSLLCADLTETFLEVTILEGDSETMLQDTICQGKSISFGGEMLDETGIYRDTFSLTGSCDSIVVLDLLVAQSDVTQLTAQTCEADMIGIDTLILSNQFDCDSLIITVTFLLPSDTLLIQEQTCDPLLAGQTDTLIISTPVCDSILITNFFYQTPDTTFVTIKSCLPNEIGIDTIPINSGGFCDDIQIVQTELYLTDTTFMVEITCDLNAQDPVIELFPTDTCDRVEVTTFIMVSPDTTYLSETTCEMNMAGQDTIVLTNNSGCDSLIISDITFVDSDILLLEQFSCNLEDVGTDTTFLQNENNCDSLVILTTLFSSADTTYLEELTCDINQATTTEQTFTTATCDSIVLTTFIFSAPDTTFLSITSCEENLAPDTTILQNQFTCDSIVISTFAFSASEPVENFENTCDPNQVGIFADTLTGAFCDSIVLTTFTLSASDTTRTTEFVCTEAEARTDTLFLSNETGCDSILLTSHIWEPIEPTLISSFTCDLEQVGFDTTILVSSNNCDSLLINEFIFSSSDTTFLPIVFTCNPAEVDTDTSLFVTAECDSIVISTTLLSLLDTTFLTKGSCDISLDRIDTLILNSAQGCDSIVITSIEALMSSESFAQTPVSDPSQVRLDTMTLVNAVGCDSLAITNFFLDENTSDTTFVSLPTCDPNLMLDTMITSDGGVVITTFLLESIDTTFISEITCDFEQAAEEVINLVSSEGCDSVIVVSYDLFSVDTVFSEVLTCMDMGQDTFMNTALECPIIEITTFINQGSDISFVENVSCTGPFGLDSLTLQNVAGCDSLVITNTIEAATSETNIFETTCLSDLASDTIMLSGQFCDSLVITNYIFEEISPTLISISTCDESDLDSDTLTLISAAGCDSLIITNKIFTSIDPVELTQSTCDENLIGVFVDTLISQFGCDSLVRTTFTPSMFQADFELAIEPSSCGDFADASVDILSLDEISVLWLFDDSESLTRNDLLAGDYMLQLSQGVCDTTITITVPASDGLEATLEVTYRPCSFIGGNIEVTPLSGQGPYTYMWENGSTDSIRIDLADGVYIVTVTDARGCTKESSTEITNITGLDVDTDVVDVSCFGFEDGSINITLLSGTGPYDVEWSDGADSLFRDNLSAGNYSVTISDVNNCNRTLNRAVRQPTDSIALQIEINDDLEIIVIASGGTAPYTYLWNDSTTADRIENPIPGLNYEVMVTDAHGCTETISEIFQPNAVQDTELKDIAVYPNPSTGIFNLSYDQELHLQEVTVYDIRGRKVYTQSYHNQGVFSNLDISHFIQGAYILEVQFAEGVFRDKILIFK